MSMLDLPNVTLIAVTSINLKATIRALETCQRLVRFGACKLITDEQPAVPIAGLDMIPIRRLGSAREYSQFVLADLADHVGTSHCLVVQWDGHVMNPRRWDPQFLDYDYIGASWPQFTDGHDVGNGGFSLRSRRLLEACRSPQFEMSHPEDVAIGRTNRVWLESQGLRFAPRKLADAFSAERAGSPEKTFGFHGVWHMAQMLGADRFWELYRDLEDRSTVYHDRSLIMREMLRHPGGAKRCLQMAWDSTWKTPGKRKSST